MFNRYSVIKAKLKDRLSEKTSWGRNELLTVVDEVLLAVADEEIAQITKKLDVVDEWVPSYFDDRTKL
jgi:hypothetical protein